MQRQNCDHSSPPCSAELLTELSNIDCMGFYTIQMAFQSENTPLIVMFVRDAWNSRIPLSVCAEELFDLTDISYCMKLFLIFINTL